MNPISPVGAGSSGLPDRTSQIAASTPRAQTDLSAPRGTGQTQGMSQLQRTMVNLLQASSLDPQSQQLLRLMIGLLILLAILESLRGGQGSSGDATGVLEAVAGGAGRTAAGGGGSESVTMIAHEETTTTTVVVQSAGGFSASSSDAPSNLQGGQLDLIG